MNFVMLQKIYFRLADFCYVMGSCEKKIFIIIRGFCDVGRTPFIAHIFYNKQVGVVNCHK
jgi:hypothetical protein